MDTEVDGGALAGFDDFFFDLTAHFGHNFFDASGVDAAVGHELVQGQASDFAAHGVEAGEHDGFGGVVHDDFDAGGGFQSADVATFAADDAALDFVAVDVEHGHGVFDGGFSGQALNGLNHNAFGLLIGGHLGFVHDVVDVGSGSGFSLVFEGFHQLFLGLLRGQAGDVFELFNCLTVKLIQLGGASFEGLRLGFETLTSGVDFVASASIFALELVELELALLLASFGLLHLGHALVGLLLGIGGDLEGFFAAFEHLVAFEVFGFTFGIGDDLLSASFSQAALGG